jgi:hypothetical protein
LVLGVPIEFYALEGMWIPHLMRELSKHPDFTITKESGATMTDHVDEAIATGDGSRYLISLDYSSFDATERFNNVRIHLMEGLKKGLADIGLLDTPMGPWPSMEVIIDTLYNKTKNAVFRSRDGLLLIINMVMSGEFGTITINNITNHASQDAIFERLSSTISWFDSRVRLERTQIQGDDSLVRLLVLNNPLTAQEMKEIMDVIEVVADENGLVINGLKTLFSRTKSSYLKKTFFSGFFLPRLNQIQRMTKERSGDPSSLQEMLSALGAQYAEGVARGQSETVNLNMLTFLGLGVTKIVPKVRSIKASWLPQEFLWMPTSLGGAGWYSKSVVAANKDAPIFLLSNRVERTCIDFCAHVYNKVKDTDQSAMAKQILDDEKFRRGVQFIDENLPQSRKQSSSEAQARLISLMGKGVAHPYTDYAFNQVKRVLEDDPKTRDSRTTLEDRKNALIMKNLSTLASFGINREPILVKFSDYGTMINVRARFEDKRKDWLFVRWDRRHGMTIEQLNKYANRSGFGLIVGHTGGLHHRVFLEKGEMTTDEREALSKSRFKTDYLKAVEIGDNRRASSVMLSVMRDYFSSKRKSIIVSSREWAPDMCADGKFQESEPLPFDFEVVIDGDMTREVNKWALFISKQAPSLKGKKIPRYMEREFSWISPIEYEFGEEIDYVHPVCPVSGLDYPIEEMIRRLGTSIGGDNNSIKLNRLFGDVTSDPYFPKTITDAEIFSEVTKPGIAGDVDRMTLALEAMGAAPNKARKAAAKMNSLVTKFVFVQKTQTYSTTDSILGFVNLTRKRYDEVVQVSGSIADSMMVRTVQTLGALVTLMGGSLDETHPVLRSVKLLVRGVDVGKMMNIVRGRFARKMDEKSGPQSILYA